jgi:signal transduction histidine kinase
MSLSEPATGYRSPDPPPAAGAADAEIDLAAILAAWNAATDRLQKTHEALRAEVCRLSDELEIKNRELARQNRLADLGRMASHVGHEVRNSLMPLTLYLSLLRRRLERDAGSLDIVDKIKAGFTAVEATVNDLLHFTVDRDPRRQSFDVGRLVAEVCESLAPQLTAQGIDTQLDIPAGTHLLADREMFRRALLNLALNAVDAMPDGGELAITAVDVPGALELEVADSGPGVPSDIGRKVFDPFYTTKSGGTGLGLAIVQRIAEVHGGAVTQHNCPQGGAAFTLRIPRRALEAAA